MSDQDGPSDAAPSTSALLKRSVSRRSARGATATMAPPTATTGRLLRETLKLPLCADSVPPQAMATLGLMKESAAAQWIKSGYNSMPLDWVAKAFDFSAVERIVCESDPSLTPEDFRSFRRVAYVPVIYPHAGKSRGGGGGSVNHFKIVYVRRRLPYDRLAETVQDTFYKSLNAHPTVCISMTVEELVELHRNVETHPDSYWWQLCVERNRVYTRVHREYICTSSDVRKWLSRSLCAKPPSHRLSWCAYEPVVVRTDACVHDPDRLLEYPFANGASPAREPRVYRPNYESYYENWLKVSWSTKLLQEPSHREELSVPEPDAMEDKAAMIVSRGPLCAGTSMREIFYLRKYPSVFDSESYVCVKRMWNHAGHNGGRVPGLAFSTPAVQYLKSQLCGYVKPDADHVSPTTFPVSLFNGKLYVHSDLHVYVSTRMGHVPLCEFRYFALLVYQLDWMLSYNDITLSMAIAESAPEDTGFWSYYSACIYTGAVTRINCQHHSCCDELTQMVTEMYKQLFRRPPLPSQQQQQQQPAPRPPPPPYSRRRPIQPPQPYQDLRVEEDEDDEQQQQRMDAEEES